MDWREAEKVVVDKCEDLQTKLSLYTPNDIHGHYDEIIVEFYKKLEARKNSYCETKESMIFWMNMMTLCQLARRNIGQSSPRSFFIF